MNPTRLDLDISITDPATIARVLAAMNPQKTIGGIPVFETNLPSSAFFKKPRKKFTDRPKFNGKFIRSAREAAALNGMYGKAAKYRIAYKKLGSYTKAAKKYGVSAATVWGAVNRGKK